VDFQRAELRAHERTNGSWRDREADEDRESAELRIAQRFSRAKQAAGSFGGPKLVLREIGSRIDYRISR